VKCGIVYRVDFKARLEIPGIKASHPVEA
jgi:hypothetical protein